MKPEYGICRVDNEKKRTHGWLVTVQRRGEIHRRQFSDGPHGGREAALEAARAFRNEIVAKYPPFSKAEYVSRKRKHNRSGIVGVCRTCSKPTRDLPPEKQRWYWIAACPTTEGKNIRKKFSVLEHGEDGARELAVKARTEALQQLQGDFDPGATQPPSRSPHACQKRC